MSWWRLSTREITVPRGMPVMAATARPTTGVGTNGTRNCGRARSATAAYRWSSSGYVMTSVPPTSNDPGTGRSPSAAAMTCSTSAVAMGWTLLTIHDGTGVAGRRSTMRRTSSNDVEPEPSTMAARSTVEVTEDSVKTFSTCRRERM